MLSIIALINESRFTLQSENRRFLPSEAKLIIPHSNLRGKFKYLIKFGMNNFEYRNRMQIFTW